MQNYKLIRAIEKMVDPTNSATINYMQQYMKFVPRKMQNKIIENGSKKNEYMGLIVEPYPLFLCYEIIDTKSATSLLTSDYRLIKTKIFDDDLIEKYYMIFGAFNVRSSAFYGTRLETYVIAENIKTKMLSWVIIEYDTNTISFDLSKGLSAKNTSSCILTTTYDANILLDIKSDNHKLEVKSNINNTHTKKLCQRLWLEGNLSVSYGEELSNGNSSSFSILFNLEEVAQAEEINEYNIIFNDWFLDIIGECDKVLTFKYAQHFLSDSPGHYSNIKTKEEMELKIESIDYKTLQNYSSEKMRTMMFKSQMIPFVVIFVLILLLITKYK